MIPPTGGFLKVYPIKKKIPPFGGTGFQLRVVIQATEK
jgi:hypothetical protein